MNFLTTFLLSLLVLAHSVNSQTTPVYTYTVPSGGYAVTGNLLQFQDSINGNWDLTYDRLNRISTAHATGGTFDGLKLKWTIDSFGNIKLQEAVMAPTNGADYSWFADFPDNTNRMMSRTNATGGVITYDANGNLTYDGRNHYIYDDEQRLCASQSYAGGVVQYVYDAGGRRTAKASIGTDLSCIQTAVSSAPLSTYVLGQDGEQLTELQGRSTWLHSNVFGSGALLATYDQHGLHFPLTDPLGTVRAQGSGQGILEEVCSSLPYGDGRTCIGIQDPTEHFYTSKERDTESGLDNFGARYFGSSMGRFMSPDYSDMTFGPDPVPNADVTNPQSLNLYAYAQNNPVRNVDPDGHDCVNTSNTSTYGTVAVTSGTSCASDPGKYGTYVNGTVDASSITATSKPSGTDFSYNFTSYDGQSGGAGVITQAPSYGPLEGAANLAGAAMIGSGTKAIGVFAGASVVGGVLGAGGLAYAGADLTLSSVSAAMRFRSAQAAWLALKGTGAAALIGQFFKTGAIPPGLTPGMMQTYLTMAQAYVNSGIMPPGGVATQTARIAQLAAALGK